MKNNSFFTIAERKMEFIWNDGGRSASGFVGLTGDCVTRSIAIATGLAYRDIYRDLGVACDNTPRNGVSTTVASDFLRKQGWLFSDGKQRRFEPELMPKGVLIVHLVKPQTPQRGHFCAVVDHVIYDTWNPSEDSDYRISGYWTLPVGAANDGIPVTAPRLRQSAEQSLNQKEFDRVLHRLRSLDNTANNHASTEGEKRNALRMMQSLMLRHNLSRDDIVDDDNVESVRFTRIACPLNGRRACNWEKRLADYLAVEIFPMVRWYFGTKGHRTLFWFYGPIDDVQNCIALFREMLLTIATSAQLQYGGYSRGSGASYAEGYVRGLPRYLAPAETDIGAVSETALIHARVVAVRQAARQWLDFECGISLVASRGNGRSQHDPAAADQGQKHGAKHDVTAAHGRKRLTANEG